jgi:phosphatidylglycerol---prolipoprotein diacylglyceryl transferase
MFPVVQLGSFALPVPALALLAGVWLAIWLADRESTRLGLSADVVTYLILISLVAGVAGARLGYVGRFLGIYVADPGGIFSPNTSTFVPEVGFLVGGIAALVYGARHRLSPRPTLDALAPGAAVMGVALGVAHLAGGDAFGAPARLPWSIFLWSTYRHPSQVYEIVAALAVLGIWRWARDRRPAEGFNLLLVVALSAAARVFLEAFRGDSELLVGGVRTAQVWGLIVLGICLICATLWVRVSPETGAGMPEEQTAPAGNGVDARAPQPRHTRRRKGYRVPAGEQLRSARPSRVRLRHGT